MNSPDPVSDEHTPDGEGRDGGTERVNVEGHLRRLDEIVNALQSGGLGLDEALMIFEEGIEHVRVAEKALTKAEQRVEEILAGEKTRPLPHSGRDQDSDPA